MKTSVLESIVGVVVLGITASFFFLAYSRSGIAAEEVDGGYKVIAVFDKVDGIRVGSPVKLSGIKIGSIDDIKLDKKKYTARVTLCLEKDIELPYGTFAEVLTEGLLGEKYISLTPGGDSEILRDGDEIEFTQSSISLEQLIRKFLFKSDGQE